MDKFIDFKIIKSLALEAGFQDCAAIKAKEFDISFLYEWLNKGYNAEMQYLGNNIDKRKDPSLLLENGQTIISFIVLCIGTRQKSNVRIELKNFSLDPFYIKEIARCGTPSLCRQGLSSIATISINFIELFSTIIYPSSSILLSSRDNDGLVVPM